MNTRVARVIPEPVAIESVMQFAWTVVHRRADAIKHAAVGMGIIPHADFFLFPDGGLELHVFRDHKFVGFDRGLVDLWHPDVSRVTDDAKHRQQPCDYADYHDDVEDFFDLAVHWDAGIAQPEQHANNNQRDDERNQRHGLPPVWIMVFVFMTRT